MNNVEVIDFADVSYECSINKMNESLNNRLPVVFRGVDIGQCTQKWKNNEYLYKENPDKIVSVHVAKEKDMDFKNKNYKYENMPLKQFYELAEKDCEDQWYYLRTLGEDVRKSRADFPSQYPELSNDLTVPDIYDSTKYFSSVFRVSSKNCRLWTHYDTMDNILIQVRGTKTILFYSPFDTKYLYIEDGKSPILNPLNYDREKYPLMERATPFLAEMKSGDIVFIPALWYHNVTSHELSLAVNIFWYCLSSAQYDQKDVYGNKDPVVVQRASQSIDSLAKSLRSQLPEEFIHLYGHSLLARLATKLHLND